MAPVKQSSVWRVAGGILESRIERIGGPPGRVIDECETFQKKALPIGKAPCVGVCWSGGHRTGDESCRRQDVVGKMAGYGGAVWGMRQREK